MSARLLVVEDDRSLRTGLADAFDHEGYNVTTAEDGKVATELVFSRHFDIVILDLMLPHRGGLEILKDIREHGLTIPVLLLTVRGDENDKVLGFELGADDYLTKPFSLRELTVRVKALLRRGKINPSGSRTENPVRFRLGPTDVDLGTFQVSRAGRIEALSSKEASILALLHRWGERVVSRDRFLEEIWGEDPFVSHRTVDTHVLNLRQKVEVDPKKPRHILTVHGVGYRLQKSIDS